MAGKKRKLRKSWLMIAVLSAVFLLVLSFVLSNPAFIGKKSVHEDAKTYRTRHCLVFYPDGDIGLKKAKEVCRDVRDDSIFDYSLIPYGDYYLVSYGSNVRYFTDKEFNSLKIDGINEEEKQIINDYLLYTLKKEEPERYYDPEFIRTVKNSDLDLSKAKYSIEEEYLKCELPDYQLTLSIPLRNAQKLLNMDFGYPDTAYSKPVYIDPERPLICLTFDDGPEFALEKGSTATERIVAILKEYDANGTFYVTGYNLENRDEWSDYEAYSFLKSSIADGNEYGSHTQTHTSLLTELETADEIISEISGPIAYMKKLLNYEMLTYRPVAGEFDENVLNAQPVGAVLWDIDSEDWLSMDRDTIIDRILNIQIDSGDIIIFHDIYDETAEALETIVPELLKKGYQMVTVSEMLEYYGVDILNMKYVFSATDYR